MRSTTGWANAVATRQCGAKTPMLTKASPECLPYVDCSRFITCIEAGQQGTASSALGWLHRSSCSRCMMSGGSGAPGGAPSATAITARTHSIRCTRFRWSMTTCAAGRAKPPSFCRRIEYRGNSISDQCPIAVCAHRAIWLTAARASCMWSNAYQRTS